MYPLAALVLSSLLSLGSAAPLGRQAAPEKFVLPPPGNDGPGPTFDATATRAATSVQIKSASSSGLCFDVSNFRAGDFRFNLVPVALAKCDSTVDGQRFDLITKGEHNNVPDGSRTIIVSSQQFTCVDRRSNINDRTRPGLFACGGRAAGDGETTADQQYFFSSNASLSKGIGFPLVRNAVNNGVGAGNQCLTLNTDGFLSNTACSPPNFTPEQTWIIGGTGSIASPPSPPPPAISSSPAAVVTSKSATSTKPTTTTSQTKPFSSAPAFVVPVNKEGPGAQFDSTATRAAANSRIRNAASPDLCFDVSNFQAGNSQANLVPVALKKCDANVDGQKFDLITKGVHNNVADGSRTLITSSQQFTCVDRVANKNDKTRPGLFTCGGRADGNGQTSSNQQYFFNSRASLTGGIGFPLVAGSVNKGVGAGNSCLTLNADGFLSSTPCSPPNFSKEQTWFVENVDGTAAASPPPVKASSVAQASSTKAAAPPPISSAAPVKSSTTSKAAVSTSPSATPPATTSPKTFVLPPPGRDGPGPTFDKTATRAATRAQIRSADQNVCFDVSDFEAGDFRANLVPIRVGKCDSTVDGQKFDLITKGEHNNVADGSRTIIVSSQQLTCVDRRSNINDRTRPGLFACGGRAAGDGETTADQQYFFSSTDNTPSSLATKGVSFPLVRDAVNGGVGPGNKCLTVGSDGFLSNEDCAPPNFGKGQVWLVG